MSNKYSVLKKNTIIFTVGNVGSSLISFLLIPLFTNFLTTSEYGKIDFITMLITLFIPILTLNLVEGLVRFGLDNNYNKKNVISSIIFTLLSIFIIVGMITLLLVMIGVFNISIIYYLGIFIIVSIYQILQQYTRISDKLKVFAFSDILYTIIFSTLNIIFIANLKIGIRGYFIAYVLANIITSIFIIVTTRVDKDIRVKFINREYINEFTKYSIPLIPNSLSWWIVNASDRFIIKIFNGYSDLGVYSVANKVPQILNTFYSLFFKAWQISSIKELGKSDTEKFYSQIFLYLSKVMFSIGVCILLGINLIFTIMIGPEFKEAVLFVPILVFAIIFYTMASFIGTIYTANKKSKEILKSTIFSAIINIVINLIFMYKFGTIVACISTLISYFFLFVYRVYDSKRFMKLTINYKEIIFSSAIYSMMIVNISIFKISLITFIINCILTIIYVLFNTEYVKKIIFYFCLRGKNAK